MPGAIIKKSTLGFLRDLSRNNNRDWFNAHKEQYHQAKENAEQFLASLVEKMNTHDQIENPSGRSGLYRFYNDVRFSKTKDPYSGRFAGYLKRAKPMLRGGYYVWIEPGKSRIGCGFAHPNPEDLKRIRQDIANNYEDWNKLLGVKLLLSNFGSMQGDAVKSAPRGFSQHHPAIHLLRFKQFWFERRFSDKEVLSSDYVANVSRTFRSIRPFFDYMSYVLTTDLNGELVV